MVRILIMPDIHTKFKPAESIIEKECPDKTVFLGDYFDDFHETAEDTHNTAKWLAKSLEQQDRLHLIGNHDLHYMTGNPEFQCSGFSEFKRCIIDSYSIPWSKLVTHCYVGDHLCTHAGVSRQFFEEYATTNLEEFMIESTEDLMHIDDVDYRQKFFQAGISRGGMHKNSGIVWCDYEEFVDIPGVMQIFGHTRGSEVRQNGSHICLDTVLRHYAIYQNDTIIVKEV